MPHARQLTVLEYAQSDVRSVERLRLVAEARGIELRLARLKMRLAELQAHDSRHKVRERVADTTDELDGDLG